MTPVFEGVWGMLEQKGSEEVVLENLSVPLEGDRDVGALCGSHQG